MKRVLITGAASGLGAEIAKYYNQQGWSVCVADILKDKGEALVGQLNSEFNNNSFFLELNVTCESQWLKASQEIHSRWNGLDCLINNAGVASSGDMDKLLIQDFKWTLDVNIMGVANGCNVFIPMLKQSKGTIVNVASMAGFLHLPSMAAYNTSKAAVIALSETLYAELDTHNVHVSVLCPAFFKTDLTKTMRVTEKSSIERVNAMMESSKIKAPEVAKALFDGVKNKQLYIFTHSTEKTLWKIKRFIPALYFKLIKKVSKKIKAKMTAATI
ncbi:SDR family oxidoreductase [Marinicellulosiphila megalodicopiae]|uniref:SDR family oxidoreductase n=1 Tax=Marinicellulosiphila megalodicopiae TaxID=2724896 RepID=UPI003BAF7ECD